MNTPLTNATMNTLKRLAVLEVVSDHKFVENNGTDEDFARWFDDMVDAQVCEHNTDVRSDVYFQVCERYENNPLHEALDNAFEFAITVYHEFNQ